MRKFTDARGRDWTLEVNYASLKRVKGLTEIDLTKLVDPQDGVHELLSTDPYAVMDVLCALVKPQLDVRGMTAEELLASMQEQEAEAAQLALYEAVIDFFPPPKRELLAQALARLTAAARNVQTRRLQEAQRTLEGTDFEKLAETYWPSAASWPGSSASTPGP